MFKPEGHSSVSPYLIVSDAKAALAFIEAVFGVKPGLVVRREGGEIAHAEVKIDETIVMLGQSAGGGGESHVHVYLADPDAALARARAAGGRMVQEMEEHSDGDRRGGVTDSTGTTWWLARVVSDR